ncbi:MAG: 8-oxo-dGTP diphosphatase MutT [Bdellovibrionales bacterium]
MKTKRPTWIPVVAGIMIKENKILIGQRPEGGTLPGLWEFPGGKIELGERPQEALKRELQEELGIDSDIDQIFLSNSHTYGDKGILLVFYRVDFWRGEPKALHHSELKWIDVKELHKLDIPESNREILPQLEKILQNNK